MTTHSAFAHDVLAGALTIIDERPELAGIGVTDLASAVVSNA